VFAVDVPSAAVVRRIFAEYLDGNGDRATAGGLNRDGAPWPSARRPDWNRHRLPTAGRAARVRTILDNSRCSGYAVFGRWTREERLADPEDVAAGHVSLLTVESRGVVAVRRRVPGGGAASALDEVDLPRLRRATGHAGVPDRDAA
jgi:hypothetical protein